MEYFTIKDDILIIERFAIVKIKRFINQSLTSKLSKLIEGLKKAFQEKLEQVKEQAKSMAQNLSQGMIPTTPSSEGEKEEESNPGLSLDSITGNENVQQLQVQIKKMRKRIYKDVAIFLKSISSTIPFFKIERLTENESKTVKKILKKPHSSRPPQPSVPTQQTQSFRCLLRRCTYQRSVPAGSSWRCRAIPPVCGISNPTP